VKFVLGCQGIQGLLAGLQGERGEQALVKGSCSYCENFSGLVRSCRDAGMTLH
jgi:hypothetical protein